MRTPGLLFVAASLVAIGGAAMAAGPVDDIRAARAQSNRDIAAHDFAAFRRVLADGYTIFPGSSGAAFDLSAFERRITASFTDPDFVSYVRTPSRIVIADRGKRAAETGNWIGTWRSAEGMTRLSGVYLATWVPTTAGWRIRNESFVSLRCTGKRCTELF